MTDDLGTDLAANLARSRNGEIDADSKLAEAAARFRIGGAVKDEGHCFVAQLPPGVDVSSLCLWEDDHRLGPSDGDRDEIRAAGGGRYRTLGDKLLFSSSDGSDVRFNGRTYQLRPEQTDRDFDEIVVTADVITPDSGHCYIAPLDLGRRSARFSLWEDSARLGPGARLHDEIRALGMGRYSVWGPDLYFSTSDNSDPRVNKRTYLLRSTRKATASDKRRGTWAGAPLDRALRHLVRNAIPRDDFVPGRIVHVIGSLGPGGAERQALYTLTGLARESFESVQLLCSHPDATREDGLDFYLPSFAANRIPVRSIRRQIEEDDPEIMPSSLREIRHALPRGLAPDIADVFWELFDLRPEVVHAWLDGNNVRAGLAAALAGVPRIVLSGRSMNPSHFGFYEPCMEHAYKALLKLSQVTMVNNSYTGRDDYARWLGLAPDRIAVVHNGCEFPSTHFDEVGCRARQAHDLPSEAIVVGTVTRFSEEKCPKLFVEMAEQLLQVQSDLRFILFGTGPLWNEVEALVRSRGLSGSIKLPGITTDVWASLAAMDVFVLTSRVEGLPNVLIEAQGAGVPVVSTKVGGASETFIEGKTGFGVETPTPEALAKAVWCLVRDADRRRAMSAEASSFARRQFSAAQMIARTVELYKKQ